MGVVIEGCRMATGPDRALSTARGLSASWGMFSLEAVSGAISNAEGHFGYVGGKYSCTRKVYMFW